MAYGLEVFNADGSLNFDTSGRLSKVLAEFDTGAGPGSIAVPGLAIGAPVVVAVPVATAASFWTRMVLPVFTINVGAGVVSWTFPTRASPARAIVISY